jgi:hypothetical protein
MSRNSSDNAVITGLSNLLFLFPRVQQCQARCPDRGPDRAGPMTPERNLRNPATTRDRPELAVKQLYWDGRAAAGMAREDARARPQRQIRARSSAHVTVTRTGPARCPFLLRATPESPEVADARIPRAGHGR